MSPRIRGALSGALGAVIAAALLWAAIRFPWGGVARTLRLADAWLLWAALVVNLSSLLWKGWAWHLLLRSTTPCRWWTAQEGNLIGSAVSNFSVSLTGEAARIHVVMRRDRVPGGMATASVAWTRAAEGVGLSLFLLVAPCVLHLAPILRGVQIAAGAAMAAGLAALWSRNRIGPPEFLPRPVRSWAAAVSDLGAPRRLLGPTLFSLLNWGAQWATFHLVLVAVHVPATPAASFTALVVSNLAGLARISPGNMGIVQASMAGALLPFGISADAAVAAGLALQAIQILPVEGLAIALVGWRGLKQALADREVSSPLSSVGGDGRGDFVVGAPSACAPGAVQRPRHVAAPTTGPDR